MPEFTGSGVPPNPGHSSSRVETPRAERGVHTRPQPAPVRGEARPHASPRGRVFLAFWLVVVSVAALYYYWPRPVARQTNYAGNPSPASLPKYNPKPVRKDPEKLRAQARDLIKQKKWGEAVQLLDQAVEQLPNDLKLRKVLGICLSQSGDYHRSIRELNRVADEGGAGDDAVYHYLGHAYVGLCSYEKAIDYFKKAISLKSAANNYECGAKAIVDACQKDYRFTEYLPLARKWTERALQLGTKPENLAEVQRALREPLSYSPEQELSYQEKPKPAPPSTQGPAIILSTLPSQPLKPAINSPQRTPEELWRQAENLAKNQRWAEAIGLLEQALQQDPHSIKYRKSLGFCFLKTNQYSRAVLELENVVNNGGGDASVHHSLGHAYYKTGSYLQALRAFQNAIGLEPTNGLHYKCGSRLIIEVSKKDPRFRSRLVLAQEWADRARQFGAPAGEFSETYWVRDHGLQPVHTLYRP